MTRNGACKMVGSPPLSAVPAASAGRVGCTLPPTLLGVAPGSFIHPGRVRRALRLAVGSSAGRASEPPLGERRSRHQRALPVSRRLKKSQAYSGTSRREPGRSVNSAWRLVRGAPAARQIGCQSAEPRGCSLPSSSGWFPRLHRHTLCQTARSRPCHYPFCWRREHYSLGRGGGGGGGGAGGGGGGGAGMGGNSVLVPLGMCFGHPFRVVVA